jgi:hypothetical protein
MFVEFSSDGLIAAAYVEQQYPDQKWVPPSNEALQAFLGDAPKLGKDAKGRTLFAPGSRSAFAQAAPSQGPGSTDERS